jgi:predicted GNAT family acetyltransferase
LIDGVSVGFVVVRLVESNLALEHLYVVPEHQKKGIGSAVLGSVLKEADARSVAVKPGALHDSDSNRFYQRHGIVKTAETGRDIYCVRAPMPRQPSGLDRDEGPQQGRAATDEVRFVFAFRSQSLSLIFGFQLHA